MIKSVFHDLKISRPGLWFATLWVYVIPFNIDTEFWLDFNFWLGLLFVTFPLNYLVYGLNDLNDFKADEINLRKGNYIFGAKSSKKQLQEIPKKIALIITPFIIYFTFVSGGKMLLLLLFMIAVNYIYNFKPFRIKERPPFEILIQIGYVATAIFSIILNNLPILPWQTILYLILFAFQAHIAGEIMDIEPDLQSEKKTTATIIGRKKTKLLMLFFLISETVLLLFVFQDYPLAAFLGAFSLWLVVDIFFLFKEKPYSLAQMKLFGLAMNISALISMLWVLYSGKLLHPLF